ncbi:MAG: GNAT family N-acetyltransferase [Bacilli bacterium]|nr:GNAT family N-acetyltransferase [Bacilli bacterium]
MLVIRDALENDIEGKAFVHYTSWQEAYKEIIPQSFLDRMSLARCVEIAKNHPENTIIAEVDGKIVGFACYMVSRDIDLPTAGEINAIYVLKEFYRQKIGSKLIEACERKFTGHNTFFLWVLAKNNSAIDFYKKKGYEFDGKIKEYNFDEPVLIKRMIKVK